jgi:hypothetical protein
VGVWVNVAGVAYMSSKGEMKMSLKLMIYAAVRTGGFCNAG